MYSKEQREKALALYDKCHSVKKVMQSLGYPESRAGLYLWLKQRNSPPKKKAERKQINNAPNHPLHPSLETKLAILHRCFIEGEMPKSGYYYQKARSDRIDKYQELRKSINAAYYDNRACYGYRRIHVVLKKNGFTVSEKIVRRLMREEGLFLRIKSRQNSKFSSTRYFFQPSGR